MEHPENTEQRLTDLEIKASFTEDLLDSLNQTVARQQQQIDLLLAEVNRLRQFEPDGGTGVSAACATSCRRTIEGHRPPA